MYNTDTTIVVSYLGLPRHQHHPDGLGGPHPAQARSNLPGGRLPGQC